MRGSPVALVLTTVDAPMLSVAALAAAAAAAAAVTAFGTMSTSFTLHVLVADLLSAAGSDSDEASVIIGLRCCILDELTELSVVKLLPDSGLDSTFRSTADFSWVISGKPASDDLLLCSLLSSLTALLACPQPPSVEAVLMGAEESMLISACINEACCIKR